MATLRGIAAACLLAAACARYELRPIGCAPPARPLPRSALAWQSAGGQPAVGGRVLAVETGAPVGAVVELRTVGPNGAARSQIADSAGRFSFAPVAPGQYALLVRSIGYFRVGDTVRVTPDSGATVLAALARDFAVLDGCGGMAYLHVRRPWWRVW